MLDWEGLFSGDVGIAIQKYFADQEKLKGLELYSLSKRLYHSIARQHFLRSLTIYYRGKETGLLPCRSMIIPVHFLESLKTSVYFHQNITTLIICGRDLVDSEPQNRIYLKQVNLRMLSNLQSLTIRDSVIVGTCCLATTAIISLCFRNCTIEEPIFPLEKIKSLNLTDTHIRHLNNFPNLESLTLRGWGGVNEIEMGNLVQLTYFWIEGNYMIKGPFSVPRLTELQCFLGNISFEQQTCFLESKNVKVFKLAAMFPDSQNHSNILQLLPDFRNLNSLHIGLHPMFTVECSTLLVYPCLKKLVLTGQFTHVHKFLARNPQIEVIELYLDNQMFYAPEYSNGVNRIRKLTLNQAVNPDTSNVRAFSLLETLVMTKSTLASLQGIESLLMLQYLKIESTKTYSLKPLQALPLQKLELYDGIIKDAVVIGTLYKLCYLTIVNGFIDDVSGINQLNRWVRVRFSNLKTLDKVYDTGTEKHMKVADLFHL